MSTFDAIIIGGGLSGLSAAVELSARGCKVLVLEQHRHCGGRTYSFHDTTSGNTVDNGQHLMLGCYQATRRFLKLIGTEHLASLQPALRIDFLQPSQRQAHLACAQLPAPFHLLSGLLGMNALPMKDRLTMLRVAKGIMSTSHKKEQELDRKSVDEWLDELGQTELARKYLWNVITVGAMNNAPEKVSALMLFRVLRAAFLEQRENASLFIPRVGLSELFIHPAIRFIETRGGAVYTGAGVNTIVLDGIRVQSVQTADNRIYRARSYISAVPWYSFEDLLSASKAITRNTSEPVPAGSRGLALTSSPIISLHLWLDREITDLDFAAMLETRIQWLFNKSRLLVNEKNRPGIRQYLSLVISGAEEFVRFTKEQLVHIAMEDLRQVLPQAHDANIIHSAVVKEKRATFIPSPGLDQYRLRARTQFENLFLAGDWTATGYPATIEGAVGSGKTAADLIV
jgi:squalene-associated FAD-dependent desaturase